VKHPILNLCILAALILTGCSHAEAPSAKLVPIDFRVTSSPAAAPIASADLKQKLTPLQYSVTQEADTEPPFKNEYWDNHAPGIYVDIVSDKPLFSSLDKFDSGCGWPSFSKPINDQDIVEKTDNSLLMQRTEVRSAAANSHLGHLFDDGPGPTHARFCINSASLKFIPVSELAAAGFTNELQAFIKAGLAKPAAATETAILSGGCFWGMQEILRKIPGVIKTTVGYIGGSTPNPTYEMVCSHKTGYAESVMVVFDPTKLSYEQLLGFFFRMHDPTTYDRQENDVGAQYRSAIFYTSEKQKETAELVKEEVDRSGKWKNPVVTRITPATIFYPAEAYHQDYLEKNPGGYNCHYLRD
jgi:peptide methionine sulfoxide reductase msrA/msrB